MQTALHQAASFQQYLYLWDSVISPHVISSNLSSSLSVSYTMHCSTFPCPLQPLHTHMSLHSRVHPYFTTTHYEHAVGDQRHSGTFLSICASLSLTCQFVTVSRFQSNRFLMLWHSAFEILCEKPTLKNLAYIIIIFFFLGAFLPLIDRIVKRQEMGRDLGVPHRTDRHSWESIGDHCIEHWQHGTCS